MTKREFMLKIAKDIRKYCNNECTIRVYQDISIECLCYGDIEKRKMINDIIKNHISKNYKNIVFDKDINSWCYKGKSYFGFTVI